MHTVKKKFRNGTINNMEVKWFKIGIMFPHVFEKYAKIILYISGKYLKMFAYISEILQNILPRFLNLYVTFPNVIE